MTLVEDDVQLFAADDPFDVFERWFAEAKAGEPNDPNAMALATVDEDGLPDVRMVLLKGHDPQGFVFYTNSHSAKGRELAGQPKAALLFHWKSLRRQVRVRGRVVAATEAESDAYFASRPRASQIGAWASDQSAPLSGRSALEARIKQFDTRFEAETVPRPPHWRGYRIVPADIEFWRDRRSRLHERRLFSRVADDAPWSATMLYP
jgi:pyridoxamine 5'-phosphate oxidase